MKVLLTAFDPFGGEDINPALEAVKALELPGDDINLVKIELPTVFGKSLELLKDAVEIEKPDFILSVGQAGGRKGITVERVAINVDDARISDNEGNRPLDEAIIPEGLPAYFSNLPIKGMVEAIQKAGIQAEISNSAGTFVCNHIMYGALSLCKGTHEKMKAGFIHVPFIPSQVLQRPDMPSMPLEDIVRALKEAILAMVTLEKDLKITGGKEF